MTRKFILNISIIISLVLLFSCTNKEIKQNHSNPEVNGYVPDETTAIKIAEAIWFPVYGEKIYDEKPYHAKLKNDSIWIVEATCHTENGGAAYVEIQKSNGKILNVTHGK